MFGHIFSPGGLANLLLSVPAVLWAITFHEFCHGFAAKMLGYPFIISGAVAEGDGRGRKLGFPTANMELYEPLKVIPVLMKMILPI